MNFKTQKRKLKHRKGKGCKKTGGRCLNRRLLSAGHGQHHCVLCGCGSNVVFFIHIGMRCFLLSHPVDFVY